jgi:integrase
MGTIDRRPDGSYRVRWVDEGRQRSKHFKKKYGPEGAKVFSDQQTTGRVTGTWADPKLGRQSFHDFAVEWAESQDWKDTTRADYGPVLKRAEKVLPENATLAAIDQLVIKRARVKLQETYAPATTDLTMTYLVAIMRSAYTTRRIGADPTIGVQSRRRRSKDAARVGPDDVPTRAEVALIWKATPAPYRAAIALGSAGLRVGEVLGLSADRVDLDARLVIIDRQMQRIDNESRLMTPKGEKERTIRVPGAVALELRRHFRDHRDDGLLFQGMRGALLRRDQFYRSAWRPALVGAGLGPDRFVFHSLRHFAASSMLAEGVNPMAVAGHLGDTLETLQRVYAHWTRDDRDVPADALDRILRVDDSDAIEGALGT